MKKEKLKSMRKEQDATWELKTITNYTVSHRDCFPFHVRILFIIYGDYLNSLHGKYVHGFPIWNYVILAQKSFLCQEDS